MRISWILCAALLFVALVSAKAGLVEYDENNNDLPCGSKTLAALRDFFRPMTSFFRILSDKTPSDIALYFKVMAIYVGQRFNVTHFNYLLKRDAPYLLNKTLQEWYDEGITQVGKFDEEIAEMIQQYNTKAEQQTNHIDN